MAKKQRKRISRPAAALAPATEARPGPRPLRDFAAGTDRRSTAIALAVAAASGCMWFLATADFDVWPLAWVAALPTLWLIERAATRRRALLYAWFAGFVMNVGGFYWLTSLLTRFGHLPLPLALFGLFLLCGYHGLIVLLFAAAVRRIRLTSAERLGAPLPMVLVAPLAMVAFEIMVPLIFPYYMAITQAWVLPVIQVAELAGPVGVTALLLMVSGAIYDALTERTRRRRLVPLAAAAAVLAAALVFGFVRMHQIEARRAAAPALRIGVVQGNIPFDEKGVEHAELAAQQLADLQAASARLEQAGAQFMMWTESSYPYAVHRDQTTDFREGDPRRIREGFTVPLMLGAITAVDRRAHPEAYPYNSALMLASDGRFTARFDKIFLLMFGEYIPFLETFPSLRKIMPRNAGHFARGKEVVTLPLDIDGQSYRLGPMICYEDILPDLARRVAALHPHLLVNITNDAWFGDTSEPWEHLALSVYRAVETRSDMVRAVNTGVSAFIDANGRVYAKTYAVDPKLTPMGVDTLLGDVRLMEGGHTFYARHGDLFGYLCVAATALLWLVWPRIRAKKPD